MAERLAGKVAIVTGAGSRGPGVGNGKAATILMAREGARVPCVDAQKERAEETVGLIRAEHGEALAFAADVTRKADCEAMVLALERRGGGAITCVSSVAALRGAGRTATVYLASPEARWITGQTLVVDGGLTLTTR